MKIDVRNNKKKIIELLRSTKREGIEVLIKWLEESDYFTSPASSIYHLCIEGGLAYHSLNVYKVLLNLNDSFNIGFTRELMITVGLLHDVCKIGTYHKKMIREIEEGNFEGDFIEKEEWNGEYKRSDKFPIGHGDKSVILILQHGLKLTDKEIAMIRWHMSMYDPAFSMNQNDIFREFPDVMWLYFADHISTLFFEGK